MLNIAFVTRGCRARPSWIAAPSTTGEKRSTGWPGASLPGSTPMICRYDEREVFRLDSAVSNWERPCGEPRFRLRHVGARHLADVEAVAHLAQLLLQHLDVAALQIEDRGVAQQVHVGGGGGEQDVLLGQPEVLSRRRHLALRLPRAVGGHEAVEQGLRDRRAIGMHAHRAPLVDVRSGRTNTPRGGVEVLLGRGVAAGWRAGGSPTGRWARFRRWRARRHAAPDLRIVLVGLDQRPRQCVGHGARRKRRNRNDDRERARSPPPVSHSTEGNPNDRTCTHSHRNARKLKRILRAETSPRNPSAYGASERIGNPGEAILAQLAQCGRT